MNADGTCEQRALNLLEANVREELRSRQRMLELVEAQEHGVLENDREAVASALAELELELALSAEHAQTRARLLAELGRSFGLPPEVLTLGSVAERMGPRGDTLACMRRELRELVARLARRNRRLGALVALQRRIVRDVVGTVLGASEVDAFHSAGSLLSAEA